LHTSNAGLSPFRPTRIDCRTGRPKNSTHARRITSDTFPPGTFRTCCRQLGGNREPSFLDGGSISTLLRQENDWRWQQALTFGFTTQRGD